ncbi:hypothetical protein PILCRDRAFT_820482 [Piloderma croceum F 1598]|uniref:Uncharacterized protein n=1 Tax=Piloderma croceum (strain F 1598) TaxID=765440 RepID=A0A0C3FDW6_PILCF|nr:hypothetical protein PILCRDRAFT_820482 [Piloderma croceum F 1598]
MDPWDPPQITRKAGKRQEGRYGSPEQGGSWPRINREQLGQKMDCRSARDHRSE